MQFMTETDQFLKVDMAGRVWTPRERRKVLLDEFERGGTPAAEFARLVGIKYRVRNTPSARANDLAARACRIGCRPMKLPMHTASLPVTGAEARRVLRVMESGRAVTNPRAKAFAAEIVAVLRGEARPAARKRAK